MSKDYGIKEALNNLGIKDLNQGISTGSVWHKTKGDRVTSWSPADGNKIADIQLATLDDYNKAIEKAKKAFSVWRQIPAPKRGEIVRQIGLELRKYKEPLAKIVSYEMGKIYQEGLGEVQEMIDICDFAVGQSRQLYGFTMPYVFSHHNAPYNIGNTSHFHYHIEIYPPYRARDRIKYIAGVEMGTHTFINPTNPQENAQKLKNIQLDD